jgi:hypothetical protein
MKKLLLALALLLAPSVVFAQCNGVFPNNTVCGNVTGGTNLPRPTTTASFPSVPGGSNGQIQFNNSGALGGLTDTQVTTHINSFTSTLSGAAPLSGGGTVNFLRADGTWATPPVPSGTVISPQIRLTLVSGLAAPTTDQVGMTTVYVTPVGGGTIPIWGGSAFTLVTFAEVSQLTTDTTKSPAAVANNSIYDIFCWVDSAINRCTRGPARASDSTAGAFTFQQGIPLNTNSITNGPAAQRGTYVGSIRSNGTATIDLKFGSAAAGGGPAWFGVWNMYNRVSASPMVSDTNPAFTVGTSAVEALDVAGTGTGLGNRISILHGIDEDAVSARVHLRGISVVSQQLKFGFCLDSTAAFSSQGFTSYSNQALDMFHEGGFSGFIGTGFHFLSACESSSGGTQQGRMVTDTGGGITAITWW